MFNHLFDNSKSILDAVKFYSQDILNSEFALVAEINLWKINGYLLVIATTAHPYIFFSFNIIILS